ncbi:MAG: PspC domain-containing protein [Bacteroidales bacterium]|nr:PspC domain-containing protein [Candidatus Cacconaster merdequi]
MKKVENIGIGGKAFIIDEDAYLRLQKYLLHFKEKLDVSQKNEVMEEIEGRIAELLSSFLTNGGKVVDMTMVENIVSQLGMPDGSREDNSSYNNEESKSPGTRKYFRDPDRKSLGGVCSGLAAYFNIDVLLVRILMIVLLFCGSAGLWIYLIIWLVAPKAVTAADKCEMRGWPVTAENMAKVSNM